MKQTDGAPNYRLLHVASRRQEEMHLHKWRKNVQTGAWCCDFVCGIWLVSKWQVKTRVSEKTSYDCFRGFFFFILYLIFWMPAPMESFAFEPLNGRLTVWQSPIPLSSPELPSPSTTTVIEPQLVTVPPACFLLGSTIKRWRSAFLALRLCRSEEGDFPVRDTAGISCVVLRLPRLQLFLSGKQTARRSLILLQNCFR